MVLVVMYAVLIGIALLAPAGRSSEPLGATSGERCGVVRRTARSNTGAPRDRAVLRILNRAGAATAAS